jgi:hypothetical protein
MRDEVLVLMLHVFQTFFQCLVLSCKFLWFPQLKTSMQKPNMFIFAHCNH